MSYIWTGYIYKMKDDVPQLRFFAFCGIDHLFCRSGSKLPKLVTISAVRVPIRDLRNGETL